MHETNLYNHGVNKYILSINRSSEVKRSAKKGKIKNVGTLLKLERRGTQISQSYHLRSCACYKDRNNEIHAKYVRILQKFIFQAEWKETKLFETWKSRHLAWREFGNLISNLGVGYGNVHISLCNWLIDIVRYLIHVYHTFLYSHCVNKLFFEKVGHSRSKGQRKMVKSKNILYPFKVVHKRPSNLSMLSCKVCTCCKNINYDISAKYFRILTNLTFPADMKETQIVLNMKITSFNWEVIWQSHE